MDEKNIYKMKLHQAFKIRGSCADNLSVMRVAGGWIYTQYFSMDGHPSSTVMTSTFVPHSEQTQILTGNTPC